MLCMFFFKKKKNRETLSLHLRILFEGHYYHFLLPVYCPQAWQFYLSVPIAGKADWVVIRLARQLTDHEICRELNLCVGQNTRDLPVWLLCCLSMFFFCFVLRILVPSLKWSRLVAMVFVPSWDLVSWYLATTSVSFTDHLKPLSGCNGYEGICWYLTYKTVSPLGF